MEKNDDVVIKRLKDNRTYTIRKDRHRFFFPDEWKTFLSHLNPKKKYLFEFLFNTGVRLDEAVHIRLCDFDFERNNVRVWKTKTKAKKGESFGKPRTISLSTEYAKRIKKYISNFPPESFIFKANKKLITIQSANQMMKRVLKKTGIKDTYNFSTHNIRKTHGMYLKTLGIPIGEICTRLGHDYNTYLLHYSSADIFSERDVRIIKELLGDLYMRQRRF